MSKDYFIYGTVALIAVVIISIGAWLEGINTSRWADPQSAELDSMAAGIRNIPVLVGEWEGDIATERKELDAAIAKESGAHESLGRTYQSRNVKPVSINIICGLTRKVGIHTPDACYRGAGYTINGEIQKVEFKYLPKSSENEELKSGEGTPSAKYLTAEFKTALFERTTPGGGTERQRVYWAWKGTAPNWSAPDSPRLTWKTTEPIAKLYLSTIESANDKPEDNPIQDFVSVFLPELETLLSGTYIPPEGSLERMQTPEIPAEKPHDISLTPPPVKVNERLPDLLDTLPAGNDAEPFRPLDEDLPGLLLE